MSRGEKNWVLVAVLIILIGVTVSVLHRLDIVPLWASTLGTVLMALGAITAAIIATRASYRNEKNG
jgi:SNF family Na+-dependent transporter